MVDFRNLILKWNHIQPNTILLFFIEISLLAVEPPDHYFFYNLFDVTLFYCGYPFVYMYLLYCYTNRCKRKKTSLLSSLIWRYKILIVRLCFFDYQASAGCSYKIIQILGSHLSSIFLFLSCYSQHEGLALKGWVHCSFPDWERVRRKFFFKSFSLSVNIFVNKNASYLNYLA